MYLRNVAMWLLLGGIVSTLSPMLARAEVPKEQALTGVLTMPSETVCMGPGARDVSATILFTNHSTKNILLKLTGGQNITVLGLFGTRMLKPLLSSWMNMSDQGGTAASESVQLLPGATTEYRFRFKLSGDVLAEPGFYKVQVSYSAADQSTPSVGLDGQTNWLIFEVHDCSNH